MDILLIIVLSLILVPLVFLTSGPLRIILGLVFVLFSPGYALTAALFPRKDDLEGAERLALSFGLSIAVVPLIGYFLNFTPWGIRLQPFLFLMLGFIVAMVAIALYRRRKLPPGERFEVKLGIINFPRLALGWRSLGTWHKILSLLLVIAMGGVIATTLYMLPTTGGGEAFSEFFVLGPEGKAEKYPSKLIPGEKGRVILRIVNHEHKTMDYWVEIDINGEKVEKMAPLSLNDGEKWEQEVSFTFTKPGPKQKVEFRLYRENVEANLTTYLLIDVLEK